MDYNIVRMVDVVNKINMKPDMEKEMRANLKKLEAGEKVDRSRFVLSYAFLQKLAVAAACLAAVVCVSIPVKAYVVSKVRERMEQIPETELAEAVEMLEGYDTGGDGFSREFTAEEDERLMELAVQYNQGMFPKESLMEVEDRAGIMEDGVPRLCYIKSESAYFLPERELTDEELLQYLDYQAKLNFALEKNAESVIAENERPKKGVSAQGGISILEAESISAELMDSLFGKDVAGFEKNSYLAYDGEAEMMIDAIKYPNQYLVSFYVIHDYYYFYIDSVEGNVAYIRHSHSQLENEPIEPKEMEELLEKNRPEAERLLRDCLHRTDDITRVYGSYVVNADHVNTNGTLAYHFLTEDGTDYIVALEAKTAKLVEFRDTYYEEYIETRDRSEKALEERYGESEGWSKFERIVVEMAGY